MRYSKKPRHKPGLETREIVFNGRVIARVWFDGPKAMFFVRNFDTNETHTCGGHDSAVEKVRLTVPKAYRSMVHLKRVPQ